MIGDLGAARREMLGIQSNEELLDPLTNAKAALAIYEERKRRKQGTEDGFTAWSTYKKDKYNQFLPEATSLVNRTKAPAINFRRSIWSQDESRAS